MHKDDHECCGGTGGDSCSCQNDQDNNQLYNNTYIVEFGDKTPIFKAKVYDPKTKDIIDYKYKIGKWTVLYFYPADFTFVCPTELGDLEIAHQHFKKNGVDLFAISTDTAFSHSVWHKTEQLLSTVTYPFIADTTHEISRMFNLLNEETGFSRRATIILNPAGELSMVEIVPDSLGRSTDELIRKIDALLFTEKNGGVCPVNWKAGEQTLDPSKLVLGDVAGSK